MPYDYLVLATGAAMRPQEIPGLAEYAQTIWTPDQMRSLGASSRLRTAIESGRTQHVLFLVPPGNKCAGPLYEIVFMLETWLRRHHLRDSVCVTFTTYEETYIQAFGPRLDQVVIEQFRERGINGYTQHAVTAVEPDRVHYANGTVHTYDLLISFPPYSAAVDYPNLPVDDRGFLLTEPETRRVKGTEDVYAPGDAGNFPVKQAFLAFLQADAVADDIASRIEPGTVPNPRRFEPVSMCVMEMFDKATFAQVPSRSPATRPTRCTSAPTRPTSTWSASHRSGAWARRHWGSTCRSSSARDVPSTADCLGRPWNSASKACRRHWPPQRGRDRGRAHRDRTRAAHSDAGAARSHVRFGTRVPVTFVHRPDRSWPRSPAQRP
ncbi:hypothetical protein GCM10029992_50050 [Glycomyces albus]